MFQRISTAILIASVTAAFAACGTSLHANTAVPIRDASTASRLSALDVQHQTMRAEHGVETEAGIPIIVTDGNRHVIFPGSSIVSRSNRGVSVTAGRHTRVFSVNAVVSQAGEYHHYEPVGP